MKLYVIASGSSGNCLYFETGEFSFLVDAGVSAKRITTAIETAGLKPPEAVFLTHEHSDHISGLEVLLKKYPVPVYGSGGTLAASAAGFKGPVPKENFYRVTVGRQYSFKGISFIAHPSSHDAAEPVFYTFLEGCKKAAVMTDMGMWDKEAAKAAESTNLLYIESNHDPAMLLAGSYPYSLKQRVLGESGHLSNEDAAELVTGIMHRDLKYVILGHLSKENNYPELAYETMKNAVGHAWCFDGEPPVIAVANRDIPTGPFEI